MTAKVIAATNLDLNCVVSPNSFEKVKFRFLFFRPPLLNYGLKLCHHGKNVQQKKCNFF